MSKVDWASSESQVLLNPQFDSALTLKDLPPLESHIWLSSSGTSKSVGSKVPTKLIALSKQALLSSAKSVNDWIQSTSDDVWLKALPSFHVGGLSILARAHLSGASVVETLQKWNVSDFLESCQSNSVTLCSLVPTQVYDLASQNRKAPKSLRVVFVGGGAIADSIYEKAKQLGWPLLATYGMTECSSQVATENFAAIDSPTKTPLKVLPHLKTKADEGRLLVKGTSLLSGVYKLSKKGEWKFKEPVEKGWYKTNDLVELSEERGLKFLGRKDDVVKVLGELVNLKQLQNTYENLAQSQDSVLIAWPDQRKENEVVLVSESNDLKTVKNTVSEFNKSALGYQRITRIYFVESLPRTELGKIKAKGLLTWLQES